MDIHEIREIGYKDAEESADLPGLCMRITVDIQQEIIV